MQAIHAPGAFPLVAASAVPTVTAAQMAEVDRLAVQAFGIAVLQMMELAGSHLAEVVRVELGGDLRGRRVAVAVGPGNNGGGGLAAARHLADRGADVEVVLARPAARLSDAGRHHLAALMAMDVACRVAMYDLDDTGVAGLLRHDDLVVDAILGYRLRGAPIGDVARLLEAVASAARRVVSLDVPSGVDPDTGETPGGHITADATLTLALPKPGSFTARGAALAGRLYLGDLGLPAALFASLGVDPGTPFADGRIVEVDRAR